MVGGLEKYRIRLNSAQFQLKWPTGAEPGNIFVNNLNLFLQFASNVASDKGLRDASSQAKKKINGVTIDLSLRKDVFSNIKAFSETEEAANLNYEQKRYVEEKLKVGKRNGLLLGKEDLEEFKEKKKRISELGIDFKRCLSEDKSHF